MKITVNLSDNLTNLFIIFDIKYIYIFQKSGFWGFGVLGKLGIVDGEPMDSWSRECMAH